MGQRTQETRGPIRGRPRREVIVELAHAAPYNTPIIDVGCDHGYITAALGAIGSERAANRLPSTRKGLFAVADGLKPYRHVGMAIITGIGAREIARILENGPAPEQAILHAPDRPSWLRQWLAENGYCITHERLAPEARGFAEIMRVARGQEPHSGHQLWFGPHLPQDPLIIAHAQHSLRRWQGISDSLGQSAPERQQEVTAWITFLESLLTSLGKSPTPR